MKQHTKIVACLLMVAMLIGMLPVTAFAAENDWQQVHQGTRKYYTGLGAEASKDNYAVSVEKKLTPLGTENEFQVDLTVKTDYSIQEVSSTSDANVVLIIDVSGSMAYCAECGALEKNHKSTCNHAACTFTPKRLGSLKCGCCENWKSEHISCGSELYCPNDNSDKFEASANDQNVCKNCGHARSTCHEGLGHDFSTRLAAAKNAAKDFLGRYAENANGAKRNVALVTFSTGAKVEQDWVDVAEPGNLAAIQSKIMTLQADGGTNTHGGLMLARNLLANISNSNYVVLLTDGAPTYSLKDDYPNIMEIGVVYSYLARKYVPEYDYYGDGQKSTPETRNPAAGMAGTIKGANAVGKKTMLYTICYDHNENGDNANWLADMVASQGCALTANNAGQLNLAFDTIVTQIKNWAEAWIVTDPMGENIVFDGFKPTGTPVGVQLIQNSSGVTTGFNWDLKRVAPASDKDENQKLVYNLSYKIKLNTAAEGFVEGQAYNTNGVTELEYMMVRDSKPFGSKQTAAFDVPSVKGKIPSVNYTVNYWFKNYDTNRYVIGKTESNLPAKLWDTVTLSSDRFSKDYYQYSGGDVGPQQLTQDGMVFNLYYDKTPANVTVNHWLVKTTQTDDGTTYELASAPFDIDTYNGQYYIGDTFSATLADNGYTFQTQIGSYTSSVYTGVNLTGANATLNLYYTTVAEDGRTQVPYTANYFYRTNTWVLGADEKYALQQGSYSKSDAATVTGQGPHGGTVNLPDKKLVVQPDNTTLTYQLVPSDSTTTFSPKLDKVTLPGGHVFNYKYERESDNRVKSTVTIEHAYYDRVIVNGTEQLIPYQGGAQTLTERNGAIAYVGETYTASGDSLYTNRDGHNWTCTSTTKKITIKATGENKLTINYERDLRKPVDVYVNHAYTDYEWAYNEMTGSNFRNPVRTQTSGFVKDETKTWYQGMFYTAAQVPNGYTFNETATGSWQNVPLGPNGLQITMRYDSIPGEDPGVGDVTVQHVYNTYLTYVDADGVYHENALYTHTETDDTIHGMVGSSHAVAARQPLETIPDANGGQGSGEFTPQTGNPTNAVILGEGGQVTLHYDRHTNRAGDPIAVTVRPVFVTVERYIDVDGVEKLRETQRVGEHTYPLDGTYYRGQTVTINPDTYKERAYLPAGQEDAPWFANDTDVQWLVSLKLTEPAASELRPVYVNEVDSRVRVTVQLRHNDLFNTYKLDAKLQPITETYRGVRTGDTLSFFMNQTFDPAGKSNALPDYGLDPSKPQPTALQLTQALLDTITEIDGQENKLIYVDFYYRGEKTERDAASIQVVHHYKFTDLNPNVTIDNPRVWLSQEYYTDRFATQMFYAAYNFSTGIFGPENVTGTDRVDAVNGVGIKLVKGDNGTVNIYYEKTVNTAPATRIHVIHNYLRLDPSQAGKLTPEGTYDTWLDTQAGAMAVVPLRPNRQIDETTTLSYIYRNANYRDGSFVEGALPLPLDRDGPDSPNLAPFAVASADGKVVNVYYTRTLSSTTYTVEHRYFYNGALHGEPVISAPIHGEIGDRIDVKTIAPITTHDGVTYTFTGVTPADGLVLSAEPAQNVIVLTYSYTSGSDTGGGGKTTPTLVIPEEQPPLIEIPEEEPPLAVLPPQDEDDEIIIADESVPLGDLPLTGTPRTGGLSLLTLLGALAAAGLTVVLGRKKEDDK